MFSSSHKRDNYYFSKKELFNSWMIKSSAHPIYLKSCQFFGATLIDRTQTLDTGLNFKIIDAIPELNRSELTFAEVCHARAWEIVKATNARLKVLWSGGIDSTVALISLLKVLKHEQQLDRLLILLSKESIQEYPRFFKEVINEKLEYELIETTILEQIKKSDTIITGEHGDQLFGSDKLKYTVISQDAFSPYDQILDFVISRKLGTDKYTNEIITYLAPLIEKSPIPVVTLYDYLWWLNFSLKWQTVSMRLIHGLERSHKDLEKTVFHFFKAPNFQTWSMAHPDKKIKFEWNTYKFIAKEYIYNFHQDQNYLIHKEKEQSLKEVLVDHAEDGFLTRQSKRIRSRMGF